MDKEEVLQRAQQKNSKQLDEMELDILQKGGNIGKLVALLVCALFMVVKVIFHQPYQDVYSVYCSVLCGQYLYQWYRQRDKNSLFLGLTWGIAAVLLFVAYVLNIA